MAISFQLRTRIFAAFGLMAAISLGAAMLNIWSGQKLARQLASLTGEGVPLLRSVLEGDMAHDCARASVFRAYIGAQAGEAREVAEGTKEYREAIETLAKSVKEVAQQLTAPAHAALVRGAQAGLAAYMRTGETLLAALARDPKAAAVVTAKGEFQVAFEALADRMEKLSQAVEAELKATEQAGTAIVGQANWTAVFSSVLALLSAALIAWAIDRRTTRPLVEAVRQLDATSEGVTTATGQVADATQSLAAGASRQAASLEETSASLEEVSAMTKRNSEHAQNAATLGRQSREAAAAGLGRIEELTRTLAAIKGAVGEMQSAVTEMQGSSQEIAKIIKTIDEIAFQTNLLALNAAVEAARAGEAGMGFAVVADEVRSLAQRSAQAAKDTANKIEAAVKRSELGVAASAKVAGSLGEFEGTAGNIRTAFTGIVEQISALDKVISEIASASREQSSGTAEVNMAVGEFDKGTQAAAALAQENAASAGELSRQAATLDAIVGTLERIVSGAASPASSAKAKTAATSFPLPELATAGGSRKF